MTSKLILSGTFVGITSLDSLYLVDRYPLPDEKLRAKEHTVLAGGLAANAAVAFAILGGYSRLMTCLGQMPSADLARNDLITHRVELYDHALETDYCLPSSAIIIDAEKNTRTIISTPKPPFVPAFSDISELVGDIVMLDGYFLPLAEAVITEARQRHVPIVWDADKWRDDAYVKIIPHLNFAICGSGFMPPDCRNSQDVFNFFAGYGIDNVAITRGALPVLWKTKSADGEIPVTPSATIIDTLGAGDILHGAFCYFYLQKNDFAEALKDAMSVASLSCEFFGTRDWKSALQQTR